MKRVHLVPTTTFELTCPNAVCPGDLDIPQLRKGHYFTGHETRPGSFPVAVKLVVRCRLCNVRFEVYNPRSVMFRLDVPSRSEA